jgi:hypothetical protein
MVTENKLVEATNCCNSEKRVDFGFIFGFSKKVLSPFTHNAVKRY